MKRVIRLLPILFALPLLGLIPNSQRIEKAEAITISTGYRYFIATEDESYGIIKSGSFAGKDEFNDLTKVYAFESVSGGYKIIDLESNTYLCHYDSSNTLYFMADTTGYKATWSVVTYDTHTLLKSNSSGDYYLCYRSNAWKAYNSTTSDSNCYLTLFSVEENATPFVTAMHNIACTDLVNGPAKTGDNSWASASTAFSGLKQPTKNYLTTLAADMTDGDINTPERAVGKYDYIVNKYNKGGVVYTEFITGRSTSGLVNIDNSTLHSNSVTNTPIIIVISFITVLSFTSILILKKKR